MSGPNLPGIPLDYLESYPLAAFVLRVRAPLSSSLYPSRPKLHSRDTDVTVRQAHAEEAAFELRRSSSSSNGSTTPETLAVEKRSASPNSSDIDWSFTDGGVSPTDTGPPPSPSAITRQWEGYSVQPGPQAKAEPQNGTLRHKNNIVRPISAPLSSRSTIVWSNSHAQKITKNRPIHDIVEPHTLAALQEWAESDTIHFGTTPAPLVFTLHFGHPLVTVQLVKTATSTPPDATNHTLVVLTAITAAEPASLNATAFDKVTGPLVSAGPRAVRPGPSMPQTSSTIIPLRPPVSHPPPGSNEQSEVSPQCHLLLDSTDWTSCPVGPPNSWAPEIRSMVNIAFSSFTQDCIYIGPDLNMVYNQHYSIMVDHPKAFGRPMAEVWAALWNHLQPAMKDVWEGEPLHFVNDLILHQQNQRGRTIERYHTYSLIPIIDSNQKVLGIYNPSMENTDRILSERRLIALRNLSERTAAARSETEFYQGITDGLRDTPTDAPFVICYSVKENKSSADGTNTTVDLQLASTVGVPDNHRCAPRRLRLAISKQAGSARGSSFAAPSDRRASMASPVLSPMPSARGSFSELESPDLGRVKSVGQSSAPSVTSPAPSSSSAFSYISAKSVAPPVSTEGTAQTGWPITRALSLRQCVVVEDCSSLVEGLPVRQWDQLPDMAIVVPLVPESSSQIPCGVIIIGLNLYRPFDAEYEGWIQDIRSHLTSSLSSVTAFEEGVARQLEKEKLERAKVAWFRGSAREFRTPLTLISGPLEDLKHTNLQPAQRQQLNTAVKHVHRLQQLVTSLLDFSRMEGGHVQATFLPTDLKEFVSEIADIFRPTIARLDLDFYVKLSSQPGSEMCSVDPVLLEMLLSNLLLLSIRMTKRGSITVRLKYEKGCAIIAISDSGIGVPSEDLDSAAVWLTRFETAASSSADVDSSLNGMGVGLALVKEIVRLHEGTLQISSKTQEDYPLQHGTTFTARIPLVVANSEPIQPVAPHGTYARQVAQEVGLWAEEADSDLAVNSAGGSRSGSASHVSNGRGSLSDGLVFEDTDRLLLVDSNKDMRDYIKNIFEPYCRVLDVGKVSEALKAIDEFKPDLIIADEHLIDGKGMDILTEVRTHPTNSKVNTPFVLISPACDDESRVEAFLAGADDYIAKPFKSRELLLRVHLHMQMGKKRDKLEKLFAQREAEIAVLSDYCPSGIMRTDANGTLTYANAAFLEPAGLEPGEDLNRWSAHCDPESWAALEDTWQDIIHGDRTTTKIQWKWNTGRTMSGVFIRLDKVNPSMSGIIGCITDISYQEEKLVQAERRQQEAEESKHHQELLVDLISHEIRTPVSAILQCSSLVKENLVALKQQLRFASETGFRPTEELLADLEEDVGALDSIFQCGLVQERIAGDVLSLARIQLDMLSLHDIEMNMRREARKVLSVFSSEARMKKIDIKLVFGPTLDMLNVHNIKTDPVRLGQVVTNLISNAIRFTAASDVRQITVTYNVSFNPPKPGSFECPSSRPSPHLAPGVMPAIAPPEDTPVYVYISVRDTGPGMTPAEKNVLFQRFQQGNKMIHTRYGGSGLGLFICKKITTLLGGGIDVQSEVDKGTVFNFYIKALTVNPHSMADIGSASSNSTLFSSRLSSSSRVSSPVSSIRTYDSPPMSQSASISAPTSTTGSASPQALAANAQLVSSPPVGVLPPSPERRPLHILIVEDNIINQTVLKRQILRAGLTCETANHGQEALVAIHEAHRQSRLGEKKGFDVVLMDLEMPVMDGLTALRHIRESEAAGTLKKQLVIALTGNARQGQIDEAIKAGMDDVVIKPYRLAKLITRMNRAVVEHDEAEEK